MKQSIQFLIQPLIFFVLLLAIPSCRDSATQPSTSGAETSQVWPELMIRNSGIDNTPEWEAVVHKVNAYRSDLIADPQDPNALVGLSMLYAKEARITGEHGYYYPAILDMLDLALAQETISKENLHTGVALRANVLLAQHRFREGLEAAEYAHSLNPYNAQVYAALIDAHVELGNYARAVELGEEMMEIKPGLMTYARASYLREIYGDLPGAIEAMEYAVNAGYPGLDNAEWARVTLGSLYQKAGAWDKAEQAYMESLVYRPDYPFAKAGLAEVYIHKGNYNEAETLLKEALGSVPEIGFQTTLYELYAAWGKTELLETTYEGIIAMVEDDKAHGHKVDLDYAILIHNYGNDPDKALELALNEYNERPDNIDVNATLAGIYADLGQREKAHSHYLKATRTGKKIPPIDVLAAAIE